ncbi:MAG: 2-amino-4-hydroxy-6-hydroxymethyldihydropteridine diphosphokinase [Pseudomonadota bacterium]
MKTLSVAYIGLGSNLGSREATLHSACESLRDIASRGELWKSSIYKSVPFGGVSQGEFLNAAVALLCELTPEALLERLHDIERQHGRRRNEEQRWGPRTLDLDLLVYSDIRENTQTLVLPHPGIAERNFVLFPLNDLAPALDVPGLGSVQTLMHGCPKSGIERLTRV